LKFKTFTLILFFSTVLLTLILSTNVVGFKSELYFNMISTEEIYYVGGDGLNNFSTIQSAINQADKGDTVFVFQGFYDEHIIIQKNIFLIGEEKNFTIIDGNNSGDIITILANNTSISGFTVQHSGNTPMYDAGLEIHSNNNSIFNNIIRYNGEFAVGIFLNKSSNNVIMNNIINNNGNEGIYLENAKNNFIFNNKIYSNGHCSIVISNSENNTVIKNIINNNHCGISLWPNSPNNKILNNLIKDHPGCGISIWDSSNKNHIYQNIFFNNSLYGISIYSAQDNLIEYNSIYGSSQGLAISFSFFNIIKFNDFFNNTQNAYINNSFYNRWYRNFWDDHLKLIPKIIPAEIYLPLDSIIYFHWFNIDFFPAINPNTYRCLT